MKTLRSVLLLIVLGIGAWMAWVWYKGRNLTSAVSPGGSNVNPSLGGTAATNSDLNGSMNSGVTASGGQVMSGGLLTGPAGAGNGSVTGGNVAVPSIGGGTESNVGASLNGIYLPDAVPINTTGGLSTSKGSSLMVKLRALGRTSTT